MNYESYARHIALHFCVAKARNHSKQVHRRRHFPPTIHPVDRGNFLF